MKLWGLFFDCERQLFLGVFFLSGSLFFVTLVTYTRTMPIKSYLARPHREQFSQLVNELRQFENCEVIPSTNEELVILVTDTADEISDEKLLSRINQIESLKMLSMVSGFDTEK